MWSCFLIEKFWLVEFSNYPADNSLLLACSSQKYTEITLQLFNVSFHTELYVEPWYVLKNVFQWIDTHEKISSIQHLWLYIISII